MIGISQKILMHDKVTHGEVVPCCLSCPHQRQKYLFPGKTWDKPVRCGSPWSKEVSSPFSSQGKVTGLHGDNLVYRGGCRNFKRRVCDDFFCAKQSKAQHFLG